MTQGHSMHALHPKFHTGNSWPIEKKTFLLHLSCMFWNVCCSKQRQWSMSEDLCDSGHCRRSAGGLYHSGRGGWSTDDYQDRNSTDSL